MQRYALVLYPLQVLSKYFQQAVIFHKPSIQKTTERALFHPDECSLDCSQQYLLRILLG